MSVIKTVVTVGVLIFLFTPWVRAAAETSGALVMVEKLHSTLLQAMQQGAQAGYQGRYATLAPVVSESFDFPTIAKIVVGRFWKDLSEAQRGQFTQTFSKLSTATYASKFDSYSKEAFRHVSNEDMGEKGVLVKTELVKSNGEAVRLDYLLHQQNDHWLIVNVVANGVSDLSLKRADYSSVLKEQGFDALIALLDKKISQYENPVKE
jgi:phospholipid transport system substrate-binding protein